MKLFLSLEHPLVWALVDNRGRVSDRGEITSLENYRLPKGVQQVIGVIPGRHVACHTVDIPGKKKSHVEAALPFALEDRLTDDVENLHFQLVHWTPGEAARAAVVSADLLQRYIDTFEVSGILFSAVVADYFLLPMHRDSDLTVSTIDENTFTVRRGNDAGLELDRDGFEYWWELLGSDVRSVSVTSMALAKRLNAAQPTMQESSPDGVVEGAARHGIRISHWDIGGQFPDWLSRVPESLEVESFNLLQGKFAPRSGERGVNLLKVAVVILCVGVAVLLGGAYYQAWQLEQKDRLVDSQLREEFSSAFPGEPYLDRPRSQVSNLILASRSGHSVDSGFQQLLNAVSEIVPARSGTVEELNYREGVLTVLSGVKDLSSLDSMLEAFNGLNDIEAQLLSSGARDGKVTGRFELKAGS